MIKSIGDYLVLILSIIGSFASIIAFGIYLSPHLNNQGWIGVLFLGIVSIFFLSYNFYLVSKYRKRVRYSDIFEEINVGFAQLHNISRSGNPTIEFIIQRLTFFCDNMASAFTKINGHNIAVCIKFLSNEGKRPIVKTLVRDNKSKTNDRKTGTNDKTIHYLDLNSDFEFIYSNFENDNVDTTFYYEPRLPICKDYKNTRLNSNWLPKSKIPFIGNIIRRKYWPLKYRSTLVVPIVPLVADEQNQKAIRGFLCIDSPRESAFFEQYDVNIMKGVSDGLYNKIDLLDKLIKQASNDTIDT